MDKNGSYDIIAKLIHWISAILVIGLIALGWYMMSIERDPGSGWYFGIHKSLGLIAGALIILRVMWRLSHKPTPLPRSVPYWQAIVSRLIHGLLYVCLIVMPLTGFIGASFSRHGVAFFGLEIPSWLTNNHDLAEQFFNIHGIVVWVLVVLISIHILAAFKHLCINKDGVFQRMWF